MRIERKENNKLVEFGRLKHGDVFECVEEIIPWIKIQEIKLEYNNEVYINCINSNGVYGLLCDSCKVKHYPNAKLVLEKE